MIVPAHNEASTLAAVLDRLLRAGFEVVVVDDGSTDETWNIVCGLPVHRIRHPVNLGQGAALQTGMTYARSLGVGAIVHFDADGQHRVEDIDGLLRPIRSGEADIVLGSRFLRPSDRELIPRFRRWILRLAVVVNFLITRTWLTDAHNGLRAMSRDATTGISLRQARSAHATEIVSEARRLRLRLVEVPVTVLYTRYSRRKGQRSWSAVDTLFDIALRWFE